MNAAPAPVAWSKLLRLHARIDDLAADCVGYASAFGAAGQHECADEVTRQLEAALQQCVRELAELLRQARLRSEL